MRHRQEAIEAVFDGAAIKSVFIGDPEPGTAYVSVGSEFAIAERFRAQVCPDDQTLPIATLVVEMEAGKPTCRDLHLERRGASLSPAMLRAIPLGAYLREVVAWGAFRYTRDPDVAVAAREREPTIGQPREVNGEPAWVIQGPDRNRWDDVRELRETSRALRRQPRRGIPISDAELRDIAALYRERVRTSRAPSESLAREWGVGTSTMKRWVHRARDAGYLGPARPGAAGG